MDLCRLIYISDAASRMDDQQLGELVSKCRTKNESRGISGMLLVSGGHFMQVLEGDRLLLANLYARIESDARHTNVQQLMFKGADARLFADWGMNLVNTDRSVKLDRDRVSQALLRLRLMKHEDQAGEALTLLQEFQHQLRAKAA